MKHLFSAFGRTSGTAPGTWKLPPGRAVTLSHPEPGMLEVVYGQVWATFDGPHAGPPNDLGDHVVHAGDRLWIPAGQRLVVESWRADAPAFLNWQPRARSAPARAAPVNATCSAA
jgi:hypothetical protein